MDYELDRDIAVTPAGPGEHTASLRDGWVVGAGVNGGYLLALIGNAIRAELSDRGHTDPVSLSAYYLTPSVAGPARVRVRVLREGGRRTTVAAALVQDQDGGEVERISVLATYAEPSQGPADPERQLPVPTIPPPEDCIDLVAQAPDPAQIPPLMRRFGTRLDPAHTGWALGKPSGEGVIQGWFRLADDRPLDPIALLLVVDALPPATFDLGRMGWAPTLELTAHVRAHPAAGWAVVRHETRNISGGYFEEDCAVWDSTGLLVAQSRQLALLPR